MNAQINQIKALVAFARLKAPLQIYLCPGCNKAFTLGEVREDTGYFHLTIEDTAPFCRMCRTALVLYKRE